MRQKKSNGDPIAEELLTNAADTFFGARIQLENMLDLFQSYVAELRVKDMQVAEKAKYLHYLLLGGKAVGEFYDTIKAGSLVAGLKMNQIDKPVSQKLPFSLSHKGRFIKLVVHAYGELQSACDEYLNGKSKLEIDNAGKIEVSVSFKLVMSLAELINTKVYEVNCHMSPTYVLNFAKKLNTEAKEKDYTSGSMVPGFIGLDEKLAYKPINIDSLKLNEYPNLPKKEKVMARIKLFCKNKYLGHKQEIRSLISDLITK
jgi:hypothetical protein